VNGLILTLGVLAFVSVIALIGYRLVTRDPNAETPKRRELKRARLRAVKAQHAMNDIESSLNRYRPVMDTVESALADEISTRISVYKNEILELDK
jgi:hypothetical protein